MSSETVVYSLPATSEQLDTLYEKVRQYFSYFGAIRGRTAVVAHEEFAANQSEVLQNEVSFPKGWSYEIFMGMRVVKVSEYNTKYGVSVSLSPDEFFLAPDFFPTPA